MEYCTLDNNHAGLDRPDIEHVVENQYNYFSGSNKTQKICRHRKVPPRRITVRERTGDPVTSSRITILIAGERDATLRNTGA